MNNARYCLTKADLADAIYAALPVDKHKAAQIVEDYVEIIKEALDKYSKVMLSGLVLTRLRLSLLAVEGIHKLGNQLY